MLGLAGVALGLICFHFLSFVVWRCLR